MWLALQTLVIRLSDFPTKGLWWWWIARVLRAASSRRLACASRSGVGNGWEKVRLCSSIREPIHPPIPRRAFETSGHKACSRLKHSAVTFWHPKVESKFSNYVINAKPSRGEIWITCLGYFDSKQINSASIFYFYFYFFLKQQSEQGKQRGTKLRWFAEPGTQIETQSRHLEKSKIMD